MNNKINFETSNKSFAEIIGNSKQYIVPKYQRDYSWDEEHWRDLWEDLIEIEKQSEDKREQHYMGYLVLQKAGDNTFTIIDGQQRLTTLSLLILAGLQILKTSNDAEDKERSNVIQRMFISTKSASSLTESYKLQLNRNNDFYYRNNLANLSEKPTARNIKKTEHSMRKAKQFFEDRIKEQEWSGKQIATFAETVVANNLLFTVTEVGDDANAYKVFETINARGVQLSTPDLLKNYLFSIINDETIINEREKQWADTLQQLGKEDFSKFLRVFWNSKNKLVTKSRLFKELQNTITTPQQAINCLDELNQAPGIYSALRNKDDSLWQEIQNPADKNKIKECIHVVKIFHIAQPLSILLRAYLQYSSLDDFTKICRYLTVFCIRYHAICNWHSQNMEKVYNNIAKAIADNQNSDFVKAKLSEYMPDNNSFRSSFEDKHIQSNKTSQHARYLLIKIENQISKSNTISLDTPYTIEHILPKKGSNNDEYWREQFGDLLEQSTQRLGNLTLLTKKDNEDADDDNFAVKKNIYQDNNLKIVQKLTEYDDWNMQTLNHYQQWLAAEAVKIWNLDN